MPRAVALESPRHPESPHGEHSGPAVPGDQARPQDGMAFPSELSLSLQVARQLQPSVVWIGDTEKTFYRKVPSAERTVRPPPALSLGLFPPGAPCSASAFSREEGRKQTRGRALPPP